MARASARRKDKHRRIEEWRAQDPARFERLGISVAALAELERNLVGRIVLPWDPRYDRARQETNPAFQAFPQVIVYCEIAYDVELCLLAARAYHLWVCVRSGGHSTAGYSVNSGMVIDVSGLNHVEVDADAMTVVVGTGADFDRLNGALNNTGLHVPSGQCGDVHVGGFVQGGGYGYTSRCFGVQCDSVLAFRVMLASGEVVAANSDENADLYWAMRGGTGGNFGVLLEVTFQLYPVASVWAYSIQWPIGDAAAALLEMQTNYMLTGAPKELGATTIIGRHDSVPVLLMQGIYVGSADAGKQALDSLLHLGSHELLVDKSGSYGTMNHLLENCPYAIPDPPKGSSEAKRAGYIKQPLALADWQQIVDYVQMAPNPNDSAVIEPYGGVINTYPEAASAFVHRDVAMDFFVDAFWSHERDMPRAIEWLDGFSALMQPFVTGAVYQNYPQRGLANFAAAYWGDAYPRLMQVKAKYDPDNFFHFEQSIALAPLDGSATTPIVYQRTHL